MKTLRSLSRLIVGLVFVFSGFVKAVDPLGSTYKFTDYFNAFGLDFLSWSAFPLALFMSAAEMLIGIALLFAYRMKVVSWAVLVFMAFFTVLTFILAIFNPVTDCGCFGDALILTNWQTFGKNIVLMVFTVLIFTGRNRFQVIRGALTEWGILTFFFAASIGLSMYCYNHLPILDFRPYKIGVNIPSASAIPTDAAVDVYETRLFYENTADGKISEFTIENFPDDSTWKFSDSKSVLISKGYEPPIHDFSISAPNGEDLTEIIKSSKGFTFLLISYNLPNANMDALKKAGDYHKLSGIFPDVQFVAATASVAGDVGLVRDSLGLSYDFGTADEIALKTIIRSNPGLLLIKNGTIIGKWGHRDFPEPEELSSDFGFILTQFPFSRGTDLRNLITTPLGARNDIFNTSLVYKNILNDSLATFSMENFPQSSDWTFVNSNSEKIEQGYVSPLKDFMMLTPEGEDLANGILSQGGHVFLVSVKEPQNLDPDLLERLNKLSVVAASHPSGPVFFYAMTGLQTDQIYGFTDSFISPITFTSGNSDFVESVSGSGVSLIHIKNGRVIERWDNNSIPGPENFNSFISESPGLNDFETYITPYLFENFRTSIEEKRVYIIILGFLFLSLFIRVFFEGIGKGE